MANWFTRIFTLPKKSNSVRDVVGDKVADIIKPVFDPIFIPLVTSSVDVVFNNLYDTAVHAGCPQPVLDKLLIVYPGIKKEYLDRILKI